MHTSLTRQVCIYYTEFVKTQVYIGDLEVTMKVRRRYKKRKRRGAV